MSNVLFLLQYRGGSTLFQALQSTNVYEEPTRIAELQRLGFSKRLGTLPCNASPSFVVEVDGAVDSKSLVKKYGLTNITHRRWHGDWWGQKDSLDLIPSPYGIRSDSSFSPEAVESYRNEGWKIVALVRDPKNLVPSIYNFHGGLETSLRERYGDKYFLYLCKAVRNKYRMIIDSYTRFPDNFLICKFEDLLINPVDELYHVYTFMNAPLDLDVIRANHISIKANIEAKRVTDKAVRHSSFSDADFNNRWSLFSEDLTSIGASIFAKESQDLGY